jgi:signal transduction histidine kinase
MTFRKTKNRESNFYPGLFLVYFLVALCTGILLQISGILCRPELQMINRLYESRKWIDWTPGALKRLSLSKLLDYHDKHEIPRKWWAWDYTLSWLIEPNHPQAKQKIIVFNHMLEDEPPLEAANDHPWMKPLMHVPFSRKELAGIIEYLARSGARLIILDNDFPQYSEEDKDLALAVHRAASGDFGGRKVPVLMANTVNRRGAANLLQIDVPTAPVGVLHELSKLEPGQDVQSKYTGTTSMLVDEDQVIRQAACRIPSDRSKDHESIAVKVISLIGEPLPANLPSEMDIDFTAPPNSEIFPVRPFSYLLDPDLKAQMAGKTAANADVNLSGAIVIIGDGITDIHATPFTNLGVNMMSGPEILAYTIDTVSRASWHKRLTLPFAIAYLMFCSFAAAAMLCLWKYPQHKNGWDMTNANLASGRSVRKYLFELCADLVFYMALVGMSFLSACLLFTFAGLIVPVVVPASALTFAAVASALWERENERINRYKRELEHAQENMRLMAEKHEFELRTQTAEARAQIIMKDERRRKEFVQRINHDLKAPVTAMIWILTKLKKDGLQSPSAGEKIERLSNTSNRLVDLLHELASSYERGDNSEDEESILAPCLLNTSIQDCVAMAKPEADKRASKIELILPDRQLWVLSKELELKRIFDNLIRNAILHNPPETNVLVEVRSRAHVHQVSISDDGNGLPPEILEKIKSEVPIEASGDTFVGGMRSGLGLGIVKTFAATSRASLSVSSEPGHGTTIVLSFPSANLEAGGELNSATADERNGGNADERNGGNADERNGGNADERNGIEELRLNKALLAERNDIKETDAALVKRDDLEQAVLTEHRGSHD